MSLRDNSCLNVHIYAEFVWRSKARNSKVTGQISPELELIVFPIIISQWELFVAMITTVLSDLPKNPMLLFPRPIDAPHEIWSR